MDAADRVWFHSWMILFAVAFALSAAGLSLVFFYSNRFSRQINTLRFSAGKIAAGD